MKFSVVIPSTGREPKYLEQCLKTLHTYTDMTSMAMPHDGVEVLVVLNGAPPNLALSLKRAWPKVRFITRKEPLGYPAACNLGIKAAQGQYVVLLNDDVELLPQEPSAWLRQLEQPFLDHPTAGLSGPLLGYSEPADAMFLVFFCVCIKAEVFAKVGLLDTAFTPGGGEDTAFCIEAVRAGYTIHQANESEHPQAHPGEGMMVGSFPMYHKGEATVGKLPDWQQVFDRNSDALRRRYNKRWVLSNEYERAVIGANDPVPPREHARYTWAAANIVGPRVVELGCSSGYGWRYFKGIPGIRYIGIDKDEPTLAFAREQFGEGPDHKFMAMNLDDPDALHKLAGADTIVAFEVLEHLEDGRAVAQRLRELGKHVLFTVPYDEPPGLWGKHHRTHNLTEVDFPGYGFRFIKGDGTLRRTPDGDRFGLLVGQFPPPPHVTCTIPTRSRYDTTLPVALAAVLAQTVLPDHVIIMDDTPKDKRIDLRELPVYQHLFAVMAHKGIGYECVWGDAKGQHILHDYAQGIARDLVWRVDDDEMPEPNVLEVLLGHLHNDVGAVGGLVLTPEAVGPLPDDATGKLSDVNGPNVQWYNWRGTREVEHLHSSFLYRARIVHYQLDLSPAAHREETLFTHALLRAGHKLIATGDCTTWHLRMPNGGIRDNHTAADFDADEAIFRKRLAEWGVKLKEPPKLFYLDNGLGDHIVFSTLVPELQAKYGKELVVACCYPGVFDGMEGLKLIDLGQAQRLGVKPDAHNIYGFMASKRWRRSLQSAYRAMYKLDTDRSAK